MEHYKSKSHKSDIMFLLMLFLIVISLAASLYAHIKIHEVEKEQILYEQAIGSVGLSLLMKKGQIFDASGKLRDGFYYLGKSIYWNGYRVEIRQ